MDESIWLVEVTRLRVGGSVHRWEVVSPTFVRLRVFAPFCFGSCMMPQRFGGLHWQLGSLWKGELLDFRLVEAFLENIGAFRSCDRFNTTTWRSGGK